ncbi:hypothetical protein BU16DRAFT_465627 [Lophium mytilinum]|uniref:Uncharacterized protein n=1 Tax=Lophium mytilinum TaxID=390894 RepID=A0A6A6QNQ3_9PEZI|nr:hypothetical protein BU16DRAFT_465627 [Lophium mytilinum]
MSAQSRSYANVAGGAPTTPDQLSKASPVQATRPRQTSPNPAYTPKTTAQEDHVYVLTLLTSPSLSTPLNALRERHFPRHLNRTAAHLTLFHALPHSQLTEILVALKSCAGRTTPFRIETGKPFRMRRGVGISVARGGPESRRIHRELREAWLDGLSEQDRGGWRPHWTVMNKEDEEQRVREAYAEVEAWEGAKGWGVGLGLWRYEKGRWVWEREERFEEKNMGENGPEGKLE